MIPPVLITFTRSQMLDLCVLPCGAVLVVWQHTGRDANGVTWQVLVSVCGETREVHGWKQI